LTPEPDSIDGENKKNKKYKYGGRSNDHRKLVSFIGVVHKINREDI
jgi:hypothetical protein